MTGTVPEERQGAGSWFICEHVCVRHVHCVSSTTFHTQGVAINVFHVTGRF